MSSIPGTSKSSSSNSVYDSQFYYIAKRVSLCSGMILGAYIVKEIFSNSAVILQYAFRPDPTIPFKTLIVTSLKVVGKYLLITFVVLIAISAFSLMIAGCLNGIDKYFQGRLALEQSKSLPL